MLFSVVIPVYNVEQYLRECLDSVMPQVLVCTPGAEILLVDDGSTDKSGEICEEYAGKYPELVRVFHKQNEGLLLTRRYGYRYAKGEYIINCDSDDLLAPGALQRLADVIRQTNADVILYNMERLFPDGSTRVIFRDTFSEKELTDVCKETVMERYLTNHNVSSLCSKCYRRSCINDTLDYGAYGRLYQAEDFMQSAEIYVKAEHIVYCNKTLYYYRMGSGMTAKFDPEYYRDSKIVFSHVQDCLLNAHMDLPNLQKMLVHRFFIITGIAILQSRNQKFLSYAERKKFLSEIREDLLFEKYVPQFGQVSINLQFQYRLMNGLLIGRHYRTIDLLLRGRNLLGR